MDAAEVGAGGSHTCARRTTGSVVCWGANMYGQLGDGTMVDSMVPVPALALSDARSLAAGAQHTCARRADDSVACWGINSVGQLGDGTFATRSTPTQVVGL